MSRILKGGNVWSFVFCTSGRAWCLDGLFVLVLGGSVLSLVKRLKGHFEVGLAWMVSATVLGACGACATGVPHTGEYGTAKPSSEGASELGGGTASNPHGIAALVLDETAGGLLVDQGAIDPLPAGPPGTFALFDPFGSMSRVGDQTSQPDFRVANLDSGKTRDFEDTLYVGKADRDDGNGFVGDFAAPRSDLIVWIARHEVGELALDDYDVFSWDGKGQPVKIGHSTADVEDVAIAAPGSGNYLTVVGDYAWWVEGELADAASSPHAYSNIFAAPLDGSSPQWVAFRGAQFPHADLCAQEPRISYVEDSTSSGSSEAFATLSSARIDSLGHVIGEPTVLWTGNSPSIGVDGADACGDHWAVAYTDWSAGPDAELHPSGVVIGGPDGVAYFELPEKSTSAGSVTVTSFGVFFFDWGGTTYGRQYFYSFTSRRLYYVGDGASFGFTRVGDDCAAMAAQVPGTSGVGPDYKLRIVCANEVPEQ